ncbi:MAG: rod shape-determining protein MreC [Actinomycetes bacterium]|jgi:rod shape-determining protein MreC
MWESRRLRTIIGLLVLTSLTLIVLSLKGGGATVRTGAQGAIGPVQNAVASVTRPIRDFFTGLGSIGSKDQTIADLRQKNDELQGQLSTNQYAQNRAKELDDLLKIASAGNYKLVPAQVVSVGPDQGFAWTVTIDAGSIDGLKVDQDVITGQGLVGRVVRVTKSDATVELLVDATSTVGARVERSMSIGFLNGTGEARSMEFQLLDPFAEIRSGDRLVSFGVRGGIYVPGLPLGTITQISGTPGQLTRVATVVPFVDVNSLDLVGVIVDPPRTNPRDALLPSAAPSAAASSQPSTGSQSSTGSDAVTPDASSAPSPSS